MSDDVDTVRRYWIAPAEVDDLTAPAVYIVVHTKWSGGDVSGTLLLGTGVGKWGHLSSSIDWLVRDLTIQFGDRREELAELYPNGYQIVVADREGVIPDEVMERNRIWGEAKDKEETS